MIKMNGSWFENMGSAILSNYAEPFDIDKANRIVPYGSDEARVIIQRVRDAEKRHVELMRKRQRSYHD